MNPTNPRQEPRNRNRPGNGTRTRATASLGDRLQRSNDVLGEVPERYTWPRKTYSSNKLQMTGSPEDAGGPVAGAWSASAVGSVVRNAVAVSSRKSVHKEWT